MSQAASNIFDIKSASLDLLALIPRTTDLETLTQALAQRFGQRSALGGEAFVIDLEGLENPEQLDLGRLLPLLRQHGLRVVGLRHPSSALAALAAQHDLVYLGDAPRADKPAAAPAPAKPAKPAAEPTPVPTMLVERPVRAGQQIYAKGSNLVVLAMVSAGAEIIADGDIHVYAPLRGRALAGARGNTAARIFARNMEAELVSIAGVYRTIEQALPDSIRGKATQIFLENERLVMTALGE
ncbi:septum site-determining protein MinC [Paludibacterium purpuratum]|uniref:Probable septum site-determining protein MinC n=1 Tax=Paludibacterium purpuratum TaxID=1144873 RepID=A0A4R7BD64_9NEIS|nr:septum site-determining protein MinC [Paludibacterium purpuratum]TDR82653.1 septum site-determining protein MinC [Paludibacterium purpuratum]